MLKDLFWLFSWPFKTTPGLVEVTLKWPWAMAGRGSASSTGSSRGCSRNAALGRAANRKLLWDCGCVRPHRATASPAELLRGWTWLLKGLRHSEPYKSKIQVCAGADLGQDVGSSPSKPCGQTPSELPALALDTCHPQLSILPSASTSPPLVVGVLREPR